MQVHQSYLSLCWFFLLPVELDDISRTLQWNKQLVISFLSFISFGYSMVTSGLKMSPKGLSRITALLDRVFFSCLICNSICTYYTTQSWNIFAFPWCSDPCSKSTLYSNCMSQGPWRVTGAKFLCSLVPFMLSVVNLKALLFYLLTDCFSYCLCGKYRTEPIASEITLVYTATKRSSLSVYSAKVQGKCKWLTWGCLGQEIRLRRNYSCCKEEQHKLPWDL